MRKLLGTIALILATLSFTQAEASIGDKVHEAGKGIRHAGRKARQAVFTRCADGRHTVKGKHGCARHGGVRDPK